MAFSALNTLAAGCSWACSLYADMIGHWEKRNGKAMENYNDFVFVHPAKLWTEMNPNFFRGIVVEKQVEKLLA